MGQSTNGMLIYGYNFGDSGSLQLAESETTADNPYGYFKASWYDAEAAEEAEDETGEEADGERLSLFDRMVKRLYDAIPDAKPAEYTWERDDIVKEHYGVWFEDYCSGDYPMYVLATHEITVYRGDVVPVDLAELASLAEQSGWNAKLARALEILDVHPLQAEPKWLLASYWG